MDTSEFHVDTSFEVDKKVCKDAAEASKMEFFFFLDLGWGT